MEMKVWTTGHAWRRGVIDGWKQKKLSVGLSWDADSPNNEAYDRGATMGELLAQQPTVTVAALVAGLELEEK